MQTKRQISCCLGNEEGGGERQEWEITNRLEKTVGGEVDVLLIMVVVSWVYTFAKTYRMARFKYVQFITCQLYLNGAVKKNYFCRVPSF